MQNHHMSLFMTSAPLYMTPFTLISCIFSINISDNLHAYDHYQVFIALNHPPIHPYINYIFIQSKQYSITIEQLVFYHLRTKKYFSLVQQDKNKSTFFSIEERTYSQQNEYLVPLYSSDRTSSYTVNIMQPLRYDPLLSGHGFIGTHNKILCSIPDVFPNTIYHVKDRYPKQDIIDKGLLIHKQKIYSHSWDRIILSNTVTASTPIAEYVMSNLIYSIASQYQISEYFIRYMLLIDSNNNVCVASPDIRADMQTISSSIVKENVVRGVGSLLADLDIFKCAIICAAMGDTDKLYLVHSKPLHTYINIIFLKLDDHKRKQRYAYDFFFIDYGEAYVNISASPDEQKNVILNFFHSLEPLLRQAISYDEKTRDSADFKNYKKELHKIVVEIYFVLLRYKPMTLLHNITPDIEAVIGSRYSAQYLQEIDKNVSHYKKTFMCKLYSLMQFLASDQTIEQSSLFQEIAVHRLVQSLSLQETSCNTTFLLQQISVALNEKNKEEDIEQNTLPVLSPDNAIIASTTPSEQLTTHHNKDYDDCVHPTLSFINALLDFCF